MRLYSCLLHLQSHPRFYIYFLASHSHIHPSCSIKHWLCCCLICQCQFTGFQSMPLAIFGLGTHDPWWNPLIPWPVCVHLLLDGLIGRLLGGDTYTWKAFWIVWWRPWDMWYEYAGTLKWVRGGKQRRGEPCSTSWPLYLWFLDMSQMRWWASCTVEATRTMNQSSSVRNCKGLQCPVVSSSGCPILGLSKPSIFHFRSKPFLDPPLTYNQE